MIEYHSLTCFNGACKAASGNTATIIDGKPIAEEIKFRIAGEIQRMKTAIGKSPGLAVVLVGQRRDSKTYINIKLRACEKVGIATVITELPENCTECELLDVVSRFNEDPSVHGIFVQLPLPQVISISITPSDLLVFCFSSRKLESWNFGFLEMIWMGFSICDLTFYMVHE
jgi:hypothetical protein